MLDPPDRQPRFSSFSAETTPLLLSLALLLLAVFIVLVSLSRYQDERADSVMDSVSRVFSSRVPYSGALDAPPFTGQQGKWLAVTRSFEAKISELFASYLALARISTSVLDGRLYVTFPEKALFVTQTSQIHSRGMTFLDRLIAVLSSSSSNTGYFVTFWSGRLATGRSKDGEEALSTQRSLAFVRAFIERGGDPKTLAVGEGVAENGNITLSFQARAHE